MMKHECDIVRDLLPLYAEKLGSEATTELVKEHLKGCPACRVELEKLREPVPAAPEIDVDAEPLRRLKKALLRKKVQTVLCTSAVLLALLLSILSFLTAPEYLSYSPELVTVTETDGGAVGLSFSGRVTNYRLLKVADPESRNTVYHLEVWTSPWDRLFQRPGVQDAVAVPESGKPLLIYFTQFINESGDSSSESSVCLYGAVPDSGGWMALSGLALGFWLLLHAALLLLLGGLWFLLRQREGARRRVERLLLIPVSYGLGHLCVVGFRTASCSAWRDFQLILAVGMLCYCALLLALRLFYSRRELWDILTDGRKP